jgi:anti-sigma regulatory factor (Ser/Thr protein kinase)
VTEARAVEMSIPAQAAYVRLARLNAAALAHEIGFSVDDVEDLRMAVDEACTFLLETTDLDAPRSVLEGTDRAAALHLRFVTDDGSLVVEAERVGDAVEALALGDLAGIVLGATTDAFDWDAVPGRRRVRLVKTRA